jgi:hypothetical protein
MRQDNMFAVSLKGQVHVNLADFSLNGLVYPWIGDRPETPDIPRLARNMFHNITKIAIA